MSVTAAVKIQIVRNMKWKVVVEKNAYLAEVALAVPAAYRTLTVPLMKNVVVSNAFKATTVSVIPVCRTHIVPLMKNVAV